MLFIFESCDWSLEMRELVMTPVDKTPKKEKETADVEDDLRHEWVQEDIQLEDRKPNLEEIEEDSSEL
jgi:hypothetical protein